MLLQMALFDSLSWLRSIPWGFPGGSVVKNPAANAGDVGSIPASGKSLEKEMATHSNILAWRIPWIEKPDRLQSMGCKRVRYYLVTKQATHSPYKP